MIDGFLHGGLGNLVKHDAMDRLAVQRFFLLEQLDQVPGDGLAFAIGVSCEIQCFGLFQGADDCL